MIYYACSYVPLEILMASKQPFKRIKTPTKTESELIHRNLCDYCKTAFQTVMNLEKDDVFISVDSCDAMRRISDVLKKQAKAKVITLRLPWKNNKQAVKMYKKELEHLIKELSDYYKINSFDKELSSVMKRYNEIRENIWNVHKDDHSAFEKQKTIDNAFNGEFYKPETNQQPED
ncbi:MAG: 2-hydroxyacyl-CoA dehydratase family protein, partial [Petrotogales bacterium]